MPVIGVSHGRWALPAPPAVPTATRLYVMGDSGALYKSSDGGVSWTTLPTGLSSGQFRLAVEAGPGDTDVIYVGSGADAKVSTDSGASFGTLTGPTGFLVTLEVGPDGDVYWNSTYRSSNQGASWSAIPSSGFMENATAAKLWSAYDATNISRMNLDGSSQEVIPLAGTWISGPHCYGQSDTMGLAFGAGVDFSNILEKIVGTTASVITPTGALADNPFMDARSNDGGTTILALILEQDVVNPNIGQLWRTTNGGSSWTKVVESEDLMPNALDLGPQIAYDPNDTGLWYVLGGRFLTSSADAVLWQSTDNGATWNSAVVATGETLLNVVRAVSG